MSECQKIITRWLDDLKETGFGYDNPSDFDTEAELNDAMSAEVRWYESHRES